MSYLTHFVAASAFVVAMGAPLLASAADTSGSTGLRQGGTVLALTLEEMNCASSDSSNQIPCDMKGRA